MALTIFRQLVRFLMRGSENMNTIQHKKATLGKDILDRVFISNTSGEIFICRGIVDDLIIIEKSLSGSCQCEECQRTRYKRVPVHYFDLLYTEVEGGRAC